MKKKFDMNQYFQIKRRIEECDAFYASLYNLTNINYDDSIDTACVTFDEHGNVLEMKINEVFWSSLEEEAKAFVIMHELSHIMYDHGKRIKEYELDPYISNLASDIFINHHLYENLNVNRNLFDWEKYCWVETCFPDEKDVPTNKNFEFYYQKLKQNKINPNNSPELLGNHDYDTDSEEPTLKEEETKSDQISDTLKKIIEQNPEIIDDLKDSPISESFDPKEIKKLDKQTKEKKEIAPIVKGGREKEIYQEIPEYNEQTDFKRLINILTPKKKAPTTLIQDTWVGQHRRYSSFLKQNQTISLPNVMEIEKRNKTRKEVWLFMDTSGSCSGMFPFFSKIVMELLKNKEIHCRAFSFDDICVEIKANDKKIKMSYGNNYGGFDCIEEMILEIKDKEKIKYPDNVVVLSDGAVTFDLKENLEKPENWIVLLDKEYYREVVPDKAQFFLLNDDFFTKPKKTFKSKKIR